MKPNLLYFRLIRLMIFPLIMLSAGRVIAQSAVISNPMAIGRDCGKTTGEGFKVFNYSTTTKTLSQLGVDCMPSLSTPGFSSTGGSIAFNPVDQKVYYIATTTGNNSIIWTWTPGTCPANSQTPVYTYNSTFIVGLDFSPITGTGYQIEFVGTAAPYSINLRKVTSFGPPLVAGTPQQIVLPAGVKIYQQQGDIVITPTGQMYCIFNNKMFKIDYSAYGTGTVNATYIDTMRLGTGIGLVGLSYYNGKFIGSATDQNSACIYKEIDISTTPITLNDIAAPNGSPPGKNKPANTFSSMDMASLITGIGVAKKVSNVTSLGNNNWSVQYDVKIRGYGNTTLTNVQLTDNMKSVFGTAFVSASVNAVGTLPSGLTLNTSYNGNSNINIFVGGSTSTLKVAPADSAIVRVTVQLNNPNLNQTYLNSATGTASNSLFSQSVSDLSNDDMKLMADLNSNDVPDDAGENVPTPLTIATWTALPNRIIDFNAHYTNKAVNVHWLLGDAETGLKMNVQRSSNAIDFETIGSLSLSSGNDYSWVDNEPLKMNYYRLELIYSNGKKYYSSYVQVSADQQKAIQLYAKPNPFQDAISFSVMANTNGKISYKLLDFNSNVIASGERNGLVGNNEFVISGLSKISTGSYLLQVVSNGQLFYKTVLKAN